MPSIPKKDIIVLKKYEKERVVEEEDCPVLREYENLLVMFLSDRDTDETTAVLGGLGKSIVFPEEENHVKFVDPLKAYVLIFFLWIVILLCLSYTK